MSRQPKFQAITGERLEYWLPGGVMDAVGGAKATAVCFDSTNGFLSALAVGAQKQSRKISRVLTAEKMWGAEYAQRFKRSGSLAKNKADSILDAFNKAKLEEQKLRSNGIEGPIPVCVYRATGKKSGKQRYYRRATAVHERFHAAVRRIEAKKGLQPKALGARMKNMLETEFGELGQKALALANIQQWSRSSSSIAEEVLARVEEIRKSCVRSKEDCQSIKDEFARTEGRVSGKYRSAASGGGPLVFDKTMEQLTDEITKKYGGAVAFVGAANAQMIKAYSGYGNVPAPKFKLPKSKCRKRLSKNIRFDRRSLRWIQSGSAYLLVGCPKGKYDASIDVCLVGTRAYEQVKAAKSGSCPRGFKRK